MNETNRRAVVGTGTMVSLCFILVAASVLLTHVLKISNSFVEVIAGSDLAKLMFLGSPFVFVLVVFSTWTACWMDARLWIRVCMASINGLGVIFAGIFAVILVSLFLVWPFN